MEHKEQTIGAAFGFIYACITDQLATIQNMFDWHLMSITLSSVLTFLLACASTVFFGFLGAAGGAAFKYLKLQWKRYRGK